MGNLETSVPVIININNKNHKGTAVVGEKIIISADGNKHAFLLDWKSVQYSVTYEKIATVLFLKQKKPCLHIWDQEGNKVDVIIDDGDGEVYTRKVVSLIKELRQFAIETYKQEQNRLEEERKLREAQARIEEERKRQAEIERLEEERKRQAEIERLEEERKRQEEIARQEELTRIEAERQRREELIRLEEEKRRQQELVRIEEEKRRREELLRLEEERKRQEELARIEENRRRKEELQRIRAERERREIEAGERKIVSYFMESRQERKQELLTILSQAASFDKKSVEMKRWHDSMASHFECCEEDRRLSDRFLDYLDQYRFAFHEDERVIAELLDSMRINANPNFQEIKTIDAAEQELYQKHKFLSDKRMELDKGLSFYRERIIRSYNDRLQQEKEREERARQERERQEKIRAIEEKLRRIKDSWREFTNESKEIERKIFHVKSGCEQIPYDEETSELLNKISRYLEVLMGKVIPVFHQSAGAVDNIETSYKKLSETNDDIEGYVHSCIHAHDSVAELMKDTRPLIAELEEMYAECVRIINERSERILLEKQRQEQLRQERLLKERQIQERLRREKRRQEKLQQERFEEFKRSYIDNQGQIYSFSEYADEDIEDVSEDYYVLVEAIFESLDSGASNINKVFAEHILECCKSILRRDSAPAEWELELFLDKMITLCNYHNVPEKYIKLLSREIEESYFKGVIDVNNLKEVFEKILRTNRYININYTVEAPWDNGFDFTAYLKKSDLQLSEVKEIAIDDVEWKDLLIEVADAQRESAKAARIKAYADRIHKYILSSSHAITKNMLRSRFGRIPGAAIRLAISQGGIVDFKNEYTALTNIHISSEEIMRIADDVTLVLNQNDRICHYAQLYDELIYKHSSAFRNNGIDSPERLFGYIQAALSNEFKFSNPFVAVEGTVILSPEEMIRNYVNARNIISVDDITSYFRERHISLGSLIGFFNSLNDKMFFKNREYLVDISDTGIDKEIALEIQELILDELNSTKECKAIRDLECIVRFPVIEFPWDEWLIYSVLNKWCNNLYLSTTSNQFRYSIPVVSSSWYISDDELEEIADRHSGNINATMIHKIDDLDDLDDLISDDIDLDDIDDFSLDFDDFEDFDFEVDDL